jgi:hypothetical protein
MYSDVQRLREEAAASTARAAAMVS